MSINVWVGQGNLTRDPEVKEVGDTHVCDLGLAVTERVKKDGEWTDEAHFFDVVAWGKTAENCGKYLSKGSRVTIEGRLKQDRWEDKETGANRSKVRIVARTVQFPPKSESNGAAPESSESSGDGLPF